jgi:hypothetical protein
VTNLAQVDIDAHTGFLLAEEAALKHYLAGKLTVPRPRNKADAEVAVYFRWPGSERTIKYPYITIDLLSIDPAYDLWHSETDVMDDPAEFVDPETEEIRLGMYYPSVTSDILPEGVEITDPNLSMSHFLPYRLLFQISTFATSPIDDRAIHAQMMIDVLPPRSFWIGVDADSVWRRCELIQWVSADSQETTEAGNRMFRKVYTISMETEIPTGTLSQVERIRQLHVDIYDTATEQRLPVGHATESDHSVIADSFTTVAPPEGT